MDPAWVLGPVAGGMAVLIAALVRWAAQTRTVVSASVVVFLLVMMVAMFVGTAVYFSSPGTRSLVLGLWVAAALMSVSVFPVVALILREAQRHETEGAAFLPRRLASPTVLGLWVATLVFASEFLMGRSFSLADHARMWLPSVGVWDTAAAAVASPWFAFPMAAEMALTLAWLHPRLPPPLRAVLAGQAVMMLCSPPAFAVGSAQLGAAVASSTAMGGVIGYLLWRGPRSSRDSGPTRGYIVTFLLVSAVLTIGLAQWAVGEGLGAFAVGTALEMSIFFFAVVGPERFALPSVDSPPPSGSPTP